MQQNTIKKMTKIFTLNHNTRLLFLSLLFLVIGYTVQGQVYFHNFGNGTINTHPYNVPPTTLAPNLSSSSWTNSSGAWTNFGGNTGEAIVTQSGNVNITLTFNVATNFQVDVTSFNFWRQRSGAGPQNWAMTINGIAVGNGSIPTAGSLNGTTNVLNPVAGLTGTVTVVMTLTGATGTGNFRLDDFELQGSVTSSCTAPIITSIFPITGPENTLVQINGSGFQAGSGTSAVKFNGINALGFTVLSAALIEANVPAGNSTGLVSVVTNACEGFSTGNFTRIVSTGNVSDLYISELYDAQVGDGGVIELYNGTANPINLAGYTLRRYGDIGDTVVSYEIILSGIVPAGGIYMIGIGTVPCGAVTGQDHPTGFNDNDELELVKNGVVIDNVHAPNNVGFSMIRNPNAEAPKAEFDGNDWTSSNTENCNNVGSHTTTSTPSPTMTVVNIPLACENGEVSFSATLSDPTGYIYQWKILDASGIWVNVTDTGSYSGSNTGTLTIDPVLIGFDNNQYYCVATSALNTVVSNADLLEVSVATVPVTDFTYTTPICTNSDPVLPIPATGFTTGGTYSSDANLSINPTTGEINIAASTVGPHTITYAVAADASICNDAGSSTFAIEISSSITPVTSFTYPTPNCVGIAPITPTLAPGFTPGGTFSSNANLSINAFTGQINVAASTSGYHTILYSVVANSATCTAAGSSFFTIQISNSAAPIVDFSYPTPICFNSGPIMPTLAPGFVTGGTFSSDTGLTINPTTGEINIATSTSAPHSIVYTVPANPSACQAAGSDFFTINITNAIVPITAFSYPTPVCTTNAPVSPTPAAGFVTGGTYTSDAGLSINAATGVINVGTSTAGPHTVTYTIAADLPNCNQGGNSTFVIQINNAVTPVTDFSYTTPVCGNNPTINPIPGAGFTTGGTYTSDAGLSINATTGAIIVAASSTGSHTITYTINPNSANCNPGGNDTFLIFITPVITPVTDFSYATPVCSDSAPLNPIPVAGFTTGGTYTSDAGLSINATTGTIDVTASTSGSHTITYTINPDPATCNVGGTDTANVVINAVFTPVTDFSYNTPICGNSPSITPIPAAGFATGGTYTSDAGLSINPTTGAINIAASTTGSHTITYTINPDLANCNTGGNDTFTIFITPVITPVTDFSYSTPVCSDSAPINPIPAAGFTPGGTYTSTTGLSINPITGTIDVVASAPGSYSITYTINPDPATCNIGGSDTFPIIITAVFTPVTAFTYTTPICPDGPPVSPIPNAGFAGGGTFTSDAGLSINPITGEINVAASTAGPHTVTYTILPNAAACNLGNSDSFAISIDAASLVAPITGSTAVCVGETIQLSNVTPGGTWSSSDESVATVDSTGLVTGVTSNYVDIIYTVTNTCTTSAISNITVYANPNPLLEDKYLCVSNVSGEPYNSVLLECGIPNVNFTFEWTFNGDPLPTTTNAHLATELGVYEVTVTNTISGCVNTTSCTVSASSTAVATATVSEDFNQNQIITVNVTGGSGDYLFQLDHGVPQESNIFPFAHQGEYTITIMDKNGCQDLILTVFALNYPRFFTPNGDGFNDTWGIKGLTDLKAKAYIYDRFGKLVKFLNASSEEWDGTFNGHGLPSTDYWFLLEYKNRDGLDKEFKAHFSLKR